MITNKEARELWDLAVRWLRAELKYADEEPQLRGGYADPEQGPKLLKRARRLRSSKENREGDFIAKLNELQGK